MKPTDKERLNWIAVMRPDICYVVGFPYLVYRINGHEGKTLRQAIDLAMKGGWTKKQIEKAAFKKEKK